MVPAEPPTRTLLPQSPQSTGTGEKAAGVALLRGVTAPVLERLPVSTRTGHLFTSRKPSGSVHTCPPAPRNPGTKARLVQGQTGLLTLGVPHPGGMGTFAAPGRPLLNARTHPCLRSAPQTSPGSSPRSEAVAPSEGLLIRSEHGYSGCADGPGLTGDRCGVTGAHPGRTKTFPGRYLSGTLFALTVDPTP